VDRSSAEGSLRGAARSNDATELSSGRGVEKAPTGIDGLDEITRGGLPSGRPTLVCGGAGCGKTLLATEFLVRGALQFGEPGVLVAFEETAEELAANVASLGFDLDDMVAKRQLFIDHVHVERSEMEESGEYNLDGLFIRIQMAINEVGAKRIVLDTIETLFAGFKDSAILRAELRRLFRWLKDHGLTAVITGERGEGQLTRQGLEEYVSDCVILLDHRVAEQQSIRRLRIVKYRGSAHGTNEYPFLIDEDGFSVLPITALGLAHEVSNEVVSTGVEGIDQMMEPRGIYRGSSVLVSGTAGTGKTSLSASFIDAACRRKERCLMFAYEESAPQIARNMRSIGIDLQTWIDQGLLHIHSARPTSQGLESHLVLIHKLVRELRPHAVVIDPITSLIAAGSAGETKSMAVRVIDFLKSHEVTGFYTSLTHPMGATEGTELGISSLIDTWLLVRQSEVSGERNRTLLLLKSRGMSHSNQVREFLLRDHGIELRDAYLGREGVLTGSARLAQEARDRDEQLRQIDENRQLADQLVAKRRVVESKMHALEAELHAISQGLERVEASEERRRKLTTDDQRAMARSRRADGAASRSEPRSEPWETP
jgi:circadian clock protein KaiC